MEMEPSSDWFSDSVTGDPISIHQWDLGSMEQIMTMSTHNIWENICSESYNPSSDVSGSSAESARTGRPKEQPQPQPGSSKLKPRTAAREYSSPSPRTRILCFGHEGSRTDRESDSYGNPVGVVGPKENAAAKAAAPLSNFSGRKRAFCNEEHIMAERKRREKLSMRFIALSAMVPDLKKMDKASVLEDAIMYMKKLQEKVKQLEERTTKGGQTQLSAKDESDENLPEIEARLSGENLLIRIQCENKKGALVKALSEIEDLHLTVINTSVVPFAGSLHITVTAQIEDGFSMTAKDLVKNMRSRF